METELKIRARGFGAEYYNHKIFDLLSDLESFYEFLSDQCVGYSNGYIITGTYSIDSSIYSAIQGSIESIRILVYIGRLNDAFALLRKYYDATTSGVYVSILIKEDENKIWETEESFKEIWDYSTARSWRLGKKHLYDLSNKKNKDIKTYSDIIGALRELDSDLYKIFEKDKYKKKDLCNDNVHYNSWDNFVLNDNYVFDKNKKLEALNYLYDIVSSRFCFHFAYIYNLHPEYFSSNDYVDALENGIAPEIDSQYWVASIVQDVFDKYIKVYDKELSDYILNSKLMIIE